MARRRLLLVSSGHPAIRPGGLEHYTLDLYEAFRQSAEFEPVLLTRAGPPATEATPHHGWSPFSLLRDPNQYLFYTNTFADQSQYDALFGRWPGKQVLTRFFRDFLISQQPDVVHFQHTLFLGYDIVRVAKNALPGVPLVATLHEYLPICHRDGQMVRTMNDELCHKESPRRCHECFPHVSPQTFYMRKRFIQSHLSLIDHFLAPTEHVRDQYVDWGIPAAKIQVEPQGTLPPQDRLEDEPSARPRNRFGFFGQLNPYKGADVLLEAIDRLGSDFDGRLWIFGANLEIQSPRFRERFEALLARDRENVTFAGPYDRSELGALMASIDWVVVPSIWWETGPLTVVEAFGHGRPVICSDIGGMAEKVTHDRNGLHFRRRDAEHLAEVMRRAAVTPGLWDRLRAGIPASPPRTMDDHVEILGDVYGRLLAERDVPVAVGAQVETVGGG